jgi:4-hydroxy-tetrahydrodipicolinate synthase
VRYYKVICKKEAIFLKKPLFRGAATALVTPFSPYGELDLPMLRRLLSRQLEMGIDAVVVCGTTGESPVLNAKEKQSIFMAAAEICGGKIPVVAGIGDNDTQHTVQTAKMAENCGVDGLLIVTPYYNKTTQNGAVQHYYRILESTELPAILYNVPTRTGMDLSVDTVCRIAAHPNAAGIKETSGGMEKFALLKNACPTGFALYTGNDTDTLPVLALGGDGVISVSSNLLPDVVHYLCSSFQNGDIAEAARIQLLLTPLNRLLFESVNPIPVKAAMELLGFPCGQCRLPLEQLDTQQRESLLQRIPPLLTQKYM